MITKINELIAALAAGDSAMAGELGIYFLKMLIMFAIGGILIYRQGL